MATRGLLNIHSNGRQYYYDNRILDFTTQCDFVTLYNFLNSSAAQGLGIVRRAYNFGSTTSQYAAGFEYTSSPGTGMNYFDTPNAAGNNAWAVFEFTQASPKFWFLLQFSACETQYGYDPFRVYEVFGSSPGAPANNQSFGNQGINYPYTKGPALACAISFRKDGSSPWNGTTNNNGADTKGGLVWSSGSVSFPRPNQYGGSGYRAYSSDGSAYSMNDASGMMTLREGLRTVNPYPDLGAYLGSSENEHDTYSGLMHVIIKEDTILVLTDNKGYGSYNFMYFGKYRALSANADENLNWANYVCLQQHSPYDGYQIPTRFGDTTSAVYGTRWLSQNVLDVGSDLACKIQGGANHVYTNECRGVVISNDYIVGATPASDSPSYMRHPNRAASDASGRKPGAYDVVNIPLAIYENHQNYGHIGEIDFIKLCRDIPTHATINNKSYAVFGGSAKKNLYKLVVPWDGVTNPGMNGATRQGILW